MARIPIEFPGKVQAENYNKGGADVAYYDLNKGNEGGKLRKDDVDIYQPNMGIVVGYCQKGEWLKYTVNVTADGEYEISANVAGTNGTGSLTLYMDDQPIGTEMANTGAGFDTFEVVSGGKAILKAGEHELKIEITNDWIDIDYVEFKAVAKDDPPIRIANVRFGMTEAESNFTLFDMQGHFVTNFKAAGMDAAVDMVRHGLKGIRQGVYLVRGPGKLGMKKVSVF